MLYNFSFYFLLFIIYAFCGWLIEVFVFLIKEKKIINRGFLIGPYCPIYGFCAILMILTFGKYFSTPLALFVMAGVICTFFEYITSYIMEKIFRARWWDYSDVSFNINGRVCLHNSLAFGILGMLLLYFINPFLEGILIQIQQEILICISARFINNISCR